MVEGKKLIVNENGKIETYDIIAFASEEKIVTINVVDFEGAQRSR